MSDHKRHHFILSSTATCAGIFASLARLLSSRKPKSSWRDTPRELKNRIIGSKNRVNTNILLGGLAGGIVAVATALLFAPKSGAKLIRDLTRPFSDSKAREPSGDHKKRAPVKKATAEISKAKGKVVKTIQKAVKKAAPKSPSLTHHPHALPKAADKKHSH